MIRVAIRGLVDALGTAIYIILIVLFINNLQYILPDEPKNVLIPIAMLLLFVFSAGLTGFLVFGKPIMLYLEGKKRSAIQLVVWTLAFLLIFAIFVFILIVGLSLAM